MFDRSEILRAGNGLIFQVFAPPADQISGQLRLPFLNISENQTPFMQIWWCFQRCIAKGTELIALFSMAKLYRSTARSKNAGKIRLIPGLASLCLRIVFTPV